MRQPDHEPTAPFDESFESLAAAFSKVEFGGSEAESASQRSESGQSVIHLKFQLNVAWQLNALAIQSGRVTAVRLS
jgi:hypothetical protein